jgi:hypothetical protein
MVHAKKLSFELGEGRGAEIQDFPFDVWHTPFLDTGFRQYDGKDTDDSFNKLLSHPTSTTGCSNGAN